MDWPGQNPNQTLKRRYIKGDTCKKLDELATSEAEIIDECQGRPDCLVNPPISTAGLPNGPMVPRDGCDLTGGLLGFDLCNVPNLDFIPINGINTPAGNVTTSMGFSYCAVTPWGTIICLKI